jgi:hypothetical protein
MVTLQIVPGMHLVAFNRIVEKIMFVSEKNNKLIKGSKEREFFGGTETP